MFMRKKLPFFIVTITLIALALCGWTAYAATTPGSALSTSVRGTLTSFNTDAVTVKTETGDQTVPLAKSVWVYRNDQKAQLPDLKAGDQIELILNSKQQAAYVKASSAAVEAVPSASPSASPAASAAPASAQPEPTQTPAPTAQATAAPSQSADSPKVAASLPGLEDIDLNVDGKHFKLHIKQAKNADGTTYDLNFKPDGAGMIHLKGEEAAQWIHMLLASIDLRAEGAELQIAKLLADHYNLDAGKLNVHMKTKWAQQVQQQAQQQVQQQQKPQAPKPKDDDEDQDDDEQGRKNNPKDGQGVKEGKEPKAGSKDERKDNNANKQRGSSDHQPNEKSRGYDRDDD